MAYRGITDPFTPKCTRNERFAQMSKQEQLIEQKKREIQIKLEERKKSNANEALKKVQTTSSTTKTVPVIQPSASTGTQKNVRKPFWKSHDQRWKKETQNPEDKGLAQSSNSINIFSNDGSFLDQFKKLSGVKKDTKSKKEDDASVANSNDSKSSIASNSECGQNQESGACSSDEEKKDHESSDRLQNVAEGMTNPGQEQLQSSDNGSRAAHSFEDHGSWQGQDNSPPAVSSGRPSSPYSPTRATDTPSATPVLPVQPQYRPQPQLIQAPLAMSMTTPPPPILSQQPVQQFVSYTAPPPPILSLPPPAVPGPSLPPPTALPSPLPAPSIPPPAAIATPSIPPPTALQASSITHPQPGVCPPGASLGLLHPPTILPHAVPSGLSTNTSSLSSQLLHPPPIIQQHTLSTTPILTAQSIGPATLSHTVPALSTITVSAPVLQPSLSLPLLSAPVVPSLLGHHIPPPSVSLPVAVPATADLAALTGTGEAPVADSTGEEATTQMARVVAQCGDDIEEIIKIRNPDDQALWFLHDKQSTAYIQFRCLVDRFRSEMEKEGNELSSVKVKEEKDEAGVKQEKSDDDSHLMNDIFSGGREQKFDKTAEIKLKREGKLEHGDDENSRHSEGKRSGDESDEGMTRRRKRRSRWAPESDKVDVTATAVAVSIPAVEQVPVAPVPGGQPLLSRVGRTDPAFMQYAFQAFGSKNLSEEDWKKAEDHYKIHLLYQDMMRKRQELERLQRAGKFKYEYDSDEETDGGTWEHRLRLEEMKATQLWADELTKKAEGKHHIGDFLPPDELERFMEKYSALKEGREPDLSDYKEFKLKQDNIGFQMLQKLGWTEGQGLGSDGLGITEPVNKAASRPDNQGLGLERPQDVSKGDDEYVAYRKRMMLAYRFRPNPLNNPRRPYY
ncbi:SURP and G-patch domain-containing protein 1 isoform X2 [Anabrus simplex]|uniref:SURP and G-patch domain-containing protein 1 isoform X2 n=1 Tax=Anabrus simplex TaxID=316456 RepID=UPI0035A34C0D